MATRSLGQLTLDLVAKIGGFTEPLDKAQRASRQKMKAIERDAKEAAAGFTRMVAAAGAAGAGVVALTINAAQSARELQNQASLANATTQEFQRWSYASSTVGIEQEKLADILKDTTDRVGEFLSTGGGEMKDFFTNIAPQIGVTAEQFRNLSGPQALQLYYDSLQKAGLSQQDMTFYMESMADETTALIPLLRDGGKAFDELGDQADSLGIILKDTQKTALVNFANDVDRVKNVMSAGSKVAAAELAPAMSDLAEELLNVYQAFQNGEYDTQIEVMTSIAFAAAGAAGAYKAYRGAVATATLAQYAFNTATTTNPIGALIVVLGGAAGALYTFRDELGLVDTAANNATDALDANKASIIEGSQAALDNSYSALTDSLQEVSLQAQEAILQMQELEARESFYSKSHGGVADSVRGEIESQQALLEDLAARQIDLQAAIEDNRQRRKNLLNGGDDDSGSGGGSGGTGGVTTSTDDPTKAIRDQIASLKQQAEMIGLTTDQQTLFKLAAEGATEAQLAQARAALESVAAYDDQQQALDDYRSLVEELRTPEEKLNDTLLKRLDILEAAKVSQDEYADAVARIADAGFTDAPEYEGLDASIGGAFGELGKIDEAQAELEDWYATQLEMLDNYRGERADLTEQWDAQELEKKQEYEDELARIEQARQVAQLAAAESVFGDLSDVAKTFAGEQSGIYRAMFAVQKAAAIAQSVVAIQQGIAMAAANPWPANLAAMASVASATAGIVSSISAVGMAHEGIDAVPQTGTWLLEKGERVTTSDTSAKLDRTLDSVQAGMQESGQAGVGDVTVEVMNNGVAKTANATVEQRQNRDFVIKVMLDDLKSGSDGSYTNQVGTLFNMKRKGR
ncbi:hypothetical protein [Salinicola sp. CPA57]|uniref:hypothetical protein n=1 Tax=Salinicola sp. CPA57 TaxID=1949080 RepID=UPI000DA15981|nr:hypothetical protein [Salinicola sp. CPA57]